MLTARLLPWGVSMQVSNAPPQEDALARGSKPRMPLPWAECAKTQERKWVRLKLFQCQQDGLLQTSFNLCGYGDSHKKEFIRRNTQHSGLVTGSRVCGREIFKGTLSRLEGPNRPLFLPSVFWAACLIHHTSPFPIHTPHKNKNKNKTEKPNWCFPCAFHDKNSHSTSPTYRQLYNNEPVWRVMERIIERKRLKC